MQNVNNSTHMPISIITAIVVLGLLSFTFANLFDSSNYISDELTQDELLEPIVMDFMRNLKTL